MTFKIKTINELSDSTVADLLCSALEGGSNYWYEIMEVELGDNDCDPWKEQVPNLDTQDVYKAPFCTKGYLKIADSEDGQTKVLNRESMKKGLELMAKNYSHHFNDILTENADANTGDIFLQLCLFNDVIYC
jgi:hypothetical protein